MAARDTRAGRQDTAVEGVDDRPEPEPAQRKAGGHPGRLDAGEVGEGEQAAGEHGRAADRCATVRHGRGEAGPKERADRQRAHHQRAGDRGKAPYHDEEEHAEEEDAHEGAERERERRVGHHRTTGPATVLGASGVNGARTAANRDRGGGRHRRAIGAWMMNTARQSSSWVTVPPSTGPSAAPATPAAAHQRAARCESPRRVTSTPSEPATSAAPPTPCATRAATSAASDGREPGGERRRGEHGRTRERERRAADSPQQHEPGNAGNGNGERVAGEHPRHSGDGRSELDVEVGNRKGDDRDVGERQRYCRDQHDRRDRRDAAVNRRRRRQGRGGRRGPTRSGRVHQEIGKLDARSLTAVP